MPVNHHLAQIATILPKSVLTRAKTNSELSEPISLLCSKPFRCQPGSKANDREHINNVYNRRHRIAVAGRTIDHCETRYTKMAVCLFRWRHSSKPICLASTNQSE